MAILMAKAGHDFKSIKSILYKELGKKMSQFLAIFDQKGGQELKNSKNTISLCFGRYNRSQVGTKVTKRD